MENKITFNNILSKNILHDKLKQIYQNGLPKGYNLGLSNLDNIFRFDTSKLAVITGVPNHGKSEFVDFITCQLNKKYNLKTLYFSPENQPVELHISKLISKFTCKEFNSRNITDKELNNIENYIFNNFYFMNYMNIYTIDDILSEAERLITNENVKILVIDSYNKLESQKPSNMTETDYISKLLDKLDRFTKKNDILTLLVAHPRKMEKGENNFYKCPSGYDIAGSANFLNKSDYCITVHRDFITNTTLINCEKVKFKNYGSRGETSLGYDYKSGNFYDIDVDTLDFSTNNTVNKYQPDNFVIPEINLPKNDYLNINVSWFENISDITPKSKNLKEILFSDEIKSKYIEKINHIRDAKEYSERKDRKNKSNLPCFTISCEMQDYKDSKHVKNLTNLLCVDIDYKDNIEILEQIPNILRRIEHIIYFSKSISGFGYFAIIPIQNSSNFKEYFNSIYEDFNSLGIKIDKACSDISRVRFYSIDDDYYYNENASIYTKKLGSIRKTEKQNQAKTYNLADIKTANIKMNISENDKKQLLDLLERVEKNHYNICESYETWFQIGCVLSNLLGEKGRDFFHLLSKNDKRYDKYNVDEQYDKCLDSDKKYNYNLATLFHHYNTFIDNNRINN